MKRIPRLLGRHLTASLVGIAILLVTGAVAIALSLNASKPQSVPFEAAKSLVTLAIGLVLGGLLKVLTDNHAAAKRERDEIEARFDALVADIHASHDRLEATRLLIAANRSAKTYGERMRDVIDAHVLLVRVARVPGMGVLVADRDDAACLEWMLGYLAALENEFRERYKQVSNLQRYDEEITKQRFTASATRLLAGSDGSQPEPPASQLAWEFLQDPTTFPVLEDLCQRGEQYETRFLASCRSLALRLHNGKTNSQTPPPWQAPGDPSVPWPSDRELTQTVEVNALQIASKCAARVREHPPAEAPARQPV